MDANPTMKIEEEGYPRKRGGGMKKRAKGGGMPFVEPGDKKEEDEQEEPSPHQRARKHGGKVMGEKAMHRPDKRARGGGVTSDENPLTTAGKMSKMPYESKEAKGGTEGEGTDKDPKQD